MKGFSDVRQLSNQNSSIIIEIILFYMVDLFDVIPFNNMCIAFFCSCSQSTHHPQLILAFNREERTDRQTQQLAPFHEDPNIYGGRDVLSGGTWLGLNIKTGILVFLTNFFVLPPFTRQGISRGKIVSHFLMTSLVPPSKTSQTDEIIVSELKLLSEKSHQFSPFNLTVCNLKTGSLNYMCSQWTQKNPLKLKQNEAYGLSNSDIQAQWEKTNEGKLQFRLILSQIDSLSQQELLEQLSQMMHDTTVHNDLPDEFATIFVQPHWSQRVKAERRTKSTTLVLSYQRQGKKEIVMKEITYGSKAISEVIFHLLM